VIATARQHGSTAPDATGNPKSVHVARPLLADLLETDAPRAARRRRRMLETIAVILIILWLLGMVSGYTLNNFIYILLVVAVMLVLGRLVSGRPV
jgi:hypothetical protein